MISAILVLAAFTATQPPKPDVDLAGVRVPPGFKVDLWAKEPQLGNTVAFCIDEKGRIYTSETYRFNRGTEEYRHRPFFLEGDLKNRTIDDRLKMYQHFADKFPGGMDFFAKYSDRIRLLEDRAGKGRCDTATTFADGFNHPLDGLAAGVLAKDGDVYFTCIPNLWLLKDTKGTGQADFKKSLHTGFGVQTAFLGHDLHGLIFGPDGKLYFSVGDRGYNVTTHEGKVLEGPRSGAVFRCDPDGKNLEVIHTGLRNPQELAFDQHGNLFAADNNCDKGDHSRLVYIVEGGHSGWNMAYQTIEAPYLTGPWHAEKLWHLEHEGQPAYIVPPVGKLGAGPSGFAFNSGGNGFPANTFYMANFTSRGGAGVDTFRVVPKGAGFEVVDYKNFLSGVLATDVDFGYDGRMYVSDWVEFTWDGGGTGKGRIFAVDNPETKPTGNAELLKQGIANLSTKELMALLSNADMRIRLRAQYRLAELGQVTELTTLAKDATKERIPRLHALWGLGQIARRKPEVLDAAVHLLKDGDVEIRAHSAKLLGDHDIDKAFKELTVLLKNDPEPRVRYFAIQSLGKLDGGAAVLGIIWMNRERHADFRDRYLRHAMVHALQGAGISNTDPRSPGGDFSLVAALVLRLEKHPGISVFLDDANPDLATEAARAIHDLPIEVAMEKLAATNRKDNEAILRRVLNANLRVGSPGNFERLLDVAAKTDDRVSEAMKSEAIRCLAEWPQPNPRDRVTGFWRPLPARDISKVKPLLEKAFPDLLASASPRLLPELVGLVSKYQLSIDEAQFVAWVKESKKPVEARVAALGLLAHRKHGDLKDLLDVALRSDAARLRAKAREIEVFRELSRGTELIEKVLESGDIVEKQLALPLLEILPTGSEILAEQLDRFLDKKLEPELALDVVLAGKKVKVKPIADRLAKYEAGLDKKDPLSTFRLALRGGDADRGKQVFQSHTAAQCIRCHRAQDAGGDAGPDLGKMDPKADREHFLESLIVPDKKISPGFGNVTLILTDGRVLSGILRLENEKAVILEDADKKLHTLRPDQIEERTQAKSTMPPMGQVLSLEELRDVVEYLHRLAATR